MISVNRFYSILVLLFVFLLVFVPASLMFTYLSIIKMFLLIILVALSILYYSNRIVLWGGISFIFFSIFLLFSILNSFFHGFYEKEIFFEVKSFVSFFFIVFILYYSVTNKITKPEHVLKTIMVSHFLYIVCKILLIVAFLYNSDFAKILLMNIENDLNVVLYGPLLRISLPNDLLSPIIILIILLNRFSFKVSFFKHFIEYLILLGSFINLIITFNRFNFLILIIGLSFLSVILTKKRFYYIFSILILVIAVFLISSYLMNRIYGLSIFEIWENRISIGGLQSNEEKIFQHLLFFKTISEGSLLNLLFGNGIGSFLSDYIRNTTIRYQYEAFIGVLIYQFGLIGISILLLYYLLPYIVYYRLLKNKYFFFHFTLSIMIFFVSFVNPMILNSMSAVVYSFIILNFLYIKFNLYKYKEA